MPTSFSSLSAALLPFAIDLARAGRIFTSPQLARHPLLCAYKEPEKRAREFLALHKDTFETLTSPNGEPARRRLTKEARRKLGVGHRAISGVSQRSYHWLGIGDVWLTLTFAGGRPAYWKTEPHGQFDIFTVWKGNHYFIEYQRTPITTKQWQKKWETRRKWFSEQKFDVKPRVVLIDLTSQQKETMCVPKGTIHVTKLEYLAHQMTRLPQ